MKSSQSQLKIDIEFYLKYAEFAVMLDFYGRVDF